MGTFAYAPGIRVLVESEKNGIIDISGDITDWDLTRRSNTVSSFNFTLQNTQRKYDGLFWPGDRITVELKRIVWCRVFTGTLNNSPVFSAWPRALPMSASCSLKKLQFWPWDPTTMAAYQMITKWLPINSSTKTENGDQGMSNLIVDSLVSVTNWNPKAIHIGQVPENWFGWAEDIEKSIDLKASMAAVLGSSPIVAGQNLGSSLSVSTDALPGPVRFFQSQIDVATAIYVDVLKFSGLTTTNAQDRAALIAIMTAMQESSLSPKPNPDQYGSMGYFQQTPPYWGTAAEVTDLDYSVKAFLGVTGRNGAPKGLLQKPNWLTGDPGAVAQSVQNSSYTGAYYSKWQPYAQAVVDLCRKQLDQKTIAGVGVGAVSAGLPADISLNAGLGTGSALAQTAANLILARPAGSIQYVYGAGHGGQADEIQQPTELDCSSLVNWVYYHATGHHLGNGIGTSENQYASCIKISLNDALNVQGALLFNLNGSDAEHVGVSMGDGKHVVAANNNDPGTPLVKQVDLHEFYGDFNAGGLLPDLDYSTSAGTPAAAKAVAAATKRPANVAGGSINIANLDPGSSAVTGDPTGSSVFQSILNIAVVPPNMHGNIFGGPREYINNQPFLPWLKNVVNSSMRSFCSAPNGDFIAWFPDYFDITGTAAKMIIHPIELQDFTVDWSDQQIVTHEFVTGSLMSSFDQASGSVGQFDNGYTGIYQMMFTNGIATMDDGDIFKTIYGHAASKEFLQNYLSRFGVRPNVDSMPNIQHGHMEFCMALWNFMYYWASQFSANIPMTFMPELYPGMIINIPEYNFQAYVVEVNHHGSFGNGGQFTTTAQVIAPALLDASQRSSMFGLFADILPHDVRKI